MQRSTAKKICLAACVAACAAAAAMPSRSELKKVQSLVNELMADDIQAMKAGKLKPVQVAANAEKLAGDAEGEAAKFLLYKGAFGLYVQGGSYDEAIGAIDHLNAAVRDVPDKVVAEILREKLKRIPKKNGSAIFNRYDGLCRRMAAAEERGKLEKQLKASPGDRQARRALAVRCAQMGDWKTAREHFTALGGKEAAAVKAEGADIAEAADFWWGYQPEVDGVDGEPFREYAASLYRKAINEGKLAGLKLVLAKKRVAEVGDDAGAAQRRNEPAAEEPPAKGEVADKPRGEEKKPVARARGGKRVDWSLPKNFKGTRIQDLDLGDGEAMTFLAIPAGKGIFPFNPDQQFPAHEIYITRPFWIAQFPVTLRQFNLSGIDASLEGMGGDVFEEKFADDKDAIIFASPVCKYAEQYVNWMNEKFGSSLPKGWVFRLPTQGEMFQMQPGNVRAGYKIAKRDEEQWLDAVHSKGMFTDCQTFRQVVSLGWKRRFSPNALLIGASKARKEKNSFWHVGLSRALDRISPGIESWRVPREERNARLGKALNYQIKETDPFRYVADDAPGIWWTAGSYWRSADAPETERPLFRIVVGHDYVGEWKAKNGK